MKSNRFSLRVVLAVVAIMGASLSAAAAEVERGRVVFNGSPQSIVTGPALSSGDGDIEMVLNFSADEWIGEQQRLAATYDAQKLLSAVSIAKDGSLTYEIRDRSGSVHRFATRPLELEPGARIWLRVWVDVATPDGSNARFWVSTDETEPVTEAGWGEPHVVPGNQPVHADATAGSWVLGPNLTGSISSVRLTTGTWQANGGTPAISLDFDGQPEAGSEGRRWSDIAGIWTLQPDAVHMQSQPPEVPQDTILDRYDGAALAGVANGLSGMWVSRDNPGIHWFIVDHDTLHPDRYGIFAIDAVEGRLVWRGKLKKGSGSIRSWADVEDLTGVYRNGRWFLAIWDNGNDAVYEIPEPRLDAGAALQSVSGIVPTRIVAVNGGEPGSGNVESMAWSQIEDAMYWIGPRSGGWAVNDDQRRLYRADGWSTVGSQAETRASGALVTRPAGTSVPNANGAMDISADGNLMVVQGVSSNGENRNPWVMTHRKSPSQTWTERLAAHGQPSVSESVKALTPGENVALDLDGIHVFSAGEGNRGSSWSQVIRLELP